MKFYWFKTFNPQKVHLALEELGLEYELIEVDLFKGEQKSAEFRAVNPRGKVPALDDDGFILSESMAIVAYLGDKTGRLWPTKDRSFERMRFGRPGSESGISSMRMR